MSSWTYALLVRKLEENVQIVRIQNRKYHKRIGLASAIYSYEHSAKFSLMAFSSDKVKLWQYTLI